MPTSNEKISPTGQNITVEEEDEASRLKPETPKLVTSAGWTDQATEEVKGIETVQATESVQETETEREPSVI